MIRVEGLGKRYRIGERYAHYRTFQDSLARLFGLQKPEKKNKHAQYIWAIKNISFNVKKGEAVGIIGRNGAGKTTLLRILSRITEPTEGRAIINGTVSSLLEVGTGFHQELTARENIYLNGAILGMKKSQINKRFDEIVAFAEIDKFIDTPIKRFSSGMILRLAFAIAAHLEPDILLIDEVLAVGDALFQKKCLGKMEEVAQKGRTVLFVSHNMAAVQSFCNKAMVIKEGAIDYQGDTEEAISHYLNTGNTSFGNRDLGMHPGRRPGSKSIIKGIRMLTKEAVHCNALSVGDEAVFEIDLDPVDESFNDARLSLNIHDRFGKVVMSCKTILQYPHTWSLNHPRTLRLFWDKCMLVPGIYKSSLVFSKRMEIIDWVEDPVEIEVRVDKDIYKTGKTSLQNNGVLFPMARWEI